MQTVDLIATAAFGLESVVANEVKKLGYENVTVANGRVDFTADLAAIARCNLWLRSADRVLIKIGEFDALSFEELFEQTKALAWDEWLPENAEFPVEGKSIRSKLFSVSDCQAIVKKAVVEKLKQRYHRQWFQENGPKYRIQTALLNDRVTLTIDTSGAGLHKRGYRKLSAEAPLKETLAAALVSLSRWKADRAFIDPCCGSGTIPIEAAMIGRNLAPGLARSFDAENWSQLPSALWRQAREEARDSMLKHQSLGIMGYDIDASVLNLARFHARQAGLQDLIEFQQRDVRQLGSKYKYGYLISNPPYGERLSERRETEELYRGIGQAFSRLDTWSGYIICSHPRFEDFFQRKADKKRKLYNGRIQCTYYQFFGPKPDQLQGPFAVAD
ncbi:MAG TPA: class I SAM-dependent RNA methyltransferase [Syntrophomonas sp.]|nr:class I SAM-dependent RNA methyltransferase [Syntrophomonas sp.]